MTYSLGGLIEATDYNGFTTNNANNVNAIWSTGSGDKGYGQTPALGTVAPEATVTATQWASLINNIKTMADHQGTAFSYTAPVAGDTISFLSSLSANINSITTNRGNAAARGTQYTSWTGTSSQVDPTGNGTQTWTLTFTHTITFPSADQARYFFNAGGMVKWETSKSSTGTVADTEWNDLANTLVGDIYITGGTGTQTISGTAYTGTTIVGGTGTPTTLLTTTGFYDLTTTDTLIYKQFADTSPYTGSYIQIQAKVDSNTAPTVMTLTTTWFDPGGSGQKSVDQITGGSATTGISFGTGPATVVTYYPPSSTYLTNTWGTPTVAASLSVSANTPTFVAAANTQTTTSTTALAITKPTGTTTNDLMIAFMSWGSTAGGTWTQPSGWTEVFDSGGAAVSYKVANASEGSSYTFTSSVARILGGTIVTYRSAAWDAIGTAGSGDSGYMLVPSVTPNASSTLNTNILIAWSGITANVPFATPYGMTSRSVDVDTTRGPSYNVFDEGWNNTAVGNRTVTSTTSAIYGGIQISIKTA